MKIDFMSMTLAEIVDKAKLMADIDSRYQDIAHQIELVPMDAIMLSRKARELKSIMQERRLVKECTFLLSFIGKETNNYKPVVERLEEALSRSEGRLDRYAKEALEGLS